MTRNMQITFIWISEATEKEEELLPLMNPAANFVQSTRQKDQPSKITFGYFLCLLDQKDW